VASNTASRSTATRRNHHELQVFVGVGTLRCSERTDGSEIKKGDIYSRATRSACAAGKSGGARPRGSSSKPERAGRASGLRGEHGSHFGGRNSGIGVSSGLGDIMLGSGHALQQTMFMWNSLTSGGFLPRIIMGTATDRALNNVLCTNTVSNATGTPARAPTACA